ncbi:ABC transporter ATP-binding protein, partial [Mycolicibacterium sphagni]|nr:ABC transporter ATP-binding protein [Mycolicibacterium sphagni]
IPERDAVRRRQERVRQILHTLPPAAQEAIRDDLDGTGTHQEHEFSHVEMGWKV